MKKLWLSLYLFLADVWGSLALFIICAVLTFWLRASDHVAFVVSCFMLIMVVTDGFHAWTFMRFKRVGSMLFLLAVLPIKVWVLVWLCPAPRSALCMGLAKGVLIGCVAIGITCLFALFLRKARKGTFTDPNTQNPTEWGT